MAGKTDFVTHPGDGIYLSKFQAGILSTLLTTALVAGFTNLWYLNRKSIEFEQHVSTVESPDGTLPGALSRREWMLERQIIASELRAINNKLDELKKSQDGGDD